MEFYRVPTYLCSGHPCPLVTVSKQPCLSEVPTRARRHAFQARVFSSWQGELKMATSLRLMRECDTSKQTSKEYSLVVKNRPIAVKSVSSSDSIKVKCRIASEDLPSYFCQLPAREDVRKSHFERRQSHLKCGFFCSRSSQYQEIEGATLDQKELIRTALHQEEEVDFSYFIV